MLFVLTTHKQHHEQRLENQLFVLPLWCKKIKVINLAGNEDTTVVCAALAKSFSCSSNPVYKLLLIPYPISFLFQVPLDSSSFQPRARQPIPNQPPRHLNRHRQQPKGETKKNGTHRNVRIRLTTVPTANICATRPNTERLCAFFKWRFWGKLKKSQNKSFFSGGECVLLPAMLASKNRINPRALTLPRCVPVVFDTVKSPTTRPL